MLQNWQKLKLCIILPYICQAGLQGSTVPLWETILQSAGQQNYMEQLKHTKHTEYVKNSCDKVILTHHKEWQILWGFSWQRSAKTTEN